MDLRLWPPARVADIARAVGASLVVVAAADVPAAEAMRLGPAAEVLDAAEVFALDAPDGEAGAPALPLPLPGDVAYAIFTSGSTGTPKGVVCEQGHVAAYGLGKAAVEGVGPGARLLLASAFTFDPHQGDVFTALMAGATLCLAAKDALHTRLAAALEANRATHACLTPALFSLCADAELPHLRALSLGGEAMAQVRARRTWGRRVPRLGGGGG